MHWFKKTSAIPFDDRIRTFCGQDSVKFRLWNQRIKVPMTLGQYQLQKLNGVKLSDTGESDLIYDRPTNRFYLVVTIDNIEHPIQSTKKVLGLDLGIKNIATDSTGTVWSGSEVQQTRKRYAILRAGLQSRGSKSSRRHLKRLSGKEHRFTKDVNHCISRSVVQKAKGTRSALALEELKGIRNRCIRCGHAEPADINASKVISQRAPVNGPIASDARLTRKRMSCRARCKPTTLVVGS